FFFGHDVVERDIPGRGLDVLELLACIGDADETRASPRAPRIATPAQHPVVDPAAHAESMPGAIEAEQRHEDYVDAGPDVAHSPGRVRLHELPSTAREPSVR